MPRADPGRRGRSSSAVVLRGVSPVQQPAVRVFSSSPQRHSGVAVNATATAASPQIPSRGASPRLAVPMPFNLGVACINAAASRQDAVGVKARLAAPRFSSFRRVPREPFSSQKTDCRFKRSARILCYGDSNTAGFCAYGNHFAPYGESLYRALQESGVPSEVSICGLSGLTGEEMCTELESAAVKDVCDRVGKGLVRLLDDEGHQDLVILMAGTNDLGKHQTAEATLPFVRRLHEVCHARNIPTVAMGPPQVPAMRGVRDQLSKLLQGYANDTPGVVAFLDAEVLVPRFKRGFWEPDELHFTPAGSRELGLKIMPEVLKHLAKERSRADEPSDQGLKDAEGNCPGAQAGAEAVTRRGSKTVPLGPLQVGQDLEFLSTSFGRWIPCKIIALDPAGGVEVDVKKGYFLKAEEQASRLRLPGSCADSGFSVGDQVEYFSKSYGRWVLCRVTAVEPGGGIQLDAKHGQTLSKEEQAQKVRAPTSLKAEVAAASAEDVTNRRVRAESSF
eukprot:TRINITY_DN34425_c0_g2_i1.p1 TRINITY_DN34425_c0_g2~~TRINITY_DN34425_c0_g2_i1.p1  ORF type:complete len:573 (-),score=76.28 TRINITY_DN34425_c0_g2_i1:36-1550(-)